MDREMRNGRRIYGEWAGNPRGVLENIERCIEGVFSPRSYIEHQCTKQRGHGADGLYCKQHAKRRVII